MAQERHAPITTPSDPIRVLTPSATATSSSPGRSGIKKRVPRSSRPDQSEKKEKMDSDLEGRSSGVDRSSDDAGSLSTKTTGNRWIMFALASGCCAAFNGVFAKLTTNDLTSNLSQGIAGLFGLSSLEGAIEVVVRCSFFGLNLAFNGVMWTLFTKALARGHSTTQVSIMNTSSNFVITAVLGFAIFSESLPPLWWLGAAMLVAGNVIIGQKDESSTPSSLHDDDSNDLLSDASAAEDGLGSYRDLPQASKILATALEKADGEDGEDGEDEDVLDLGELEAE